MYVEPNVWCLCFSINSLFVHQLNEFILERSPKNKSIHTTLTELQRLDQMRPDIHCALNEWSLKLTTHTHTHTGRVDPRVLWCCSAGVQPETNFFLVVSFMSMRWSGCKVTRSSPEADTCPVTHCDGQPKLKEICVTASVKTSLWWFGVWPKSTMGVRAEGRRTRSPRAPRAVISPFEQRHTCHWLAPMSQRMWSSVFDRHSVTF